MTTSASLLLYARTVRNLRPEQIVHRMRLRTQRALYQRAGDHAIGFTRARAVGPPHWPEDFTSIGASIADPAEAEAAVRGEFTFLCRTRQLGGQDRWHPTDVDQLWSYHLHYWEWALGFLRWDVPDAARSAFMQLWRDWKAGTHFGRWDEWSPYVVALRTWVLCQIYGGLFVGTGDERELLDDLALHAGYTRHNIELDVGGNHLIKDLKALVASGVLFEERWLGLGLRRLLREIDRQVLADGGHYERSASYHCQVLADLIDIDRLLSSAGLPSPGALHRAIEKMRTWLGAMLMPDGDVPLFNDSHLLGLRLIAALEPAAEIPQPPLTVLRESGYVIARPSPRVHLVADVGDPCPPDLPAHAHADCLSFELAIDGHRVIVDPGTFTYNHGERRDHDRSTASHNTVAIDQVNQTEVWGAFRAGRMARGRLISERIAPSRLTFKAQHDGYARLRTSVEHKRTFDVTAESLTITDDLLGTGSHNVTWNVLQREGSHVECEIATTQPPVQITATPATYADQLGSEQPGTRTGFSTLMPFPARVTSKFTWPPPPDTLSPPQRRPQGIGDPESRSSPTCQEY